MAPPSIQLGSLFAVPFGEARLSPCEALNRQLETLFTQRTTEEYRNPTPTHTPQSEMFESRFNLFHWPESCVQELRAFMLNSVAQTVREASTLNPADLARLQIHNHTWFHVTRYCGSFIAHTHPLASWSAVYCVRAGERVPGRPGSGALRLLDTRAAADGYQDIANRHLKPQFAFGCREIHLEEGQVVVFPSFLFHEVAPFYGRDSRITVATNCWFTVASA
jgi:uncharacterized protein (TIGR02466 family)